MDLRQKAIMPDFQSLKNPFQLIRNKIFDQKLAFSFTCARSSQLNVEHFSSFLILIWLHVRYVTLLKLEKLQDHYLWCPWVFVGSDLWKDRTGAAWRCFQFSFPSVDIHIYSTLLLNLSRSMDVHIILHFYSMMSRRVNVQVRNVSLLL